MAISTTMLNGDLDFMQDDLPSTVTFAGSTYSVAVGDATAAMNLEVEGMESPFDIAFACKVSDFTTIPQVGAVVIYNGKRRTVVRVETDPANVCFNLYCESQL